MSDPGFTWRMRLLNDEALVEIITFGESDGYVPAAVEAARAELIARDASPWAIAAIAQRLGARRNQAAERANRPLFWISRIAFSYFSIFLVPVLLACFLESQGYERKSLEAWKWSGLGLAFWIGVFAIFQLFST